MNTIKNILITIAFLFTLNTTNGWCGSVKDISPKADSCQVVAAVYPESAGTVDGCGMYPIGELIRLTATPKEGCEFRYWKINGRVRTTSPTFVTHIESDMVDVEAHFTYKPIGQLASLYSPDPDNPLSPEVSLSWEYEEKEWTLMKQFNLNGEHGVATNGKYIYTCNYAMYSPSPLLFGKYTMEGDLVELFEIDGAYPNGLACDGEYFYFGNDRQLSTVLYLYRYDLDQKVMIDRINVGMQFLHCAYDDEADGFWISDFPFNTSGTKFTLKNRQGESIMSSPVKSNINEVDFGVITAKDGTRHLLTIASNGEMYDYNTYINDFILLPRLQVPGGIGLRGAFIGKYNEKDAMYVVNKANSNDSISTLRIYEINSQLEQAIGYNIYRANSENQMAQLAEILESNTFTDTEWSELPSGLYRYGISEVYSNGNESVIIWSDPIEKINIGVEEYEDKPSSSVQKVIENGHIFIIKDGKRYNISGQHLN